MVLRIWEGLLLDPRDYAIREVRDSELCVSERIPFPIATDETTFSNVVWSVGAHAPDFEDVVSVKSTGETSRRVQAQGSIVLPGGPLYAIKSVTINKPSDADTDPSDGLVHLNVRSNVAPVIQSAPNNEYQVVVHNPEERVRTLP